MNYKEIQDLIKLINKTDISEFKLKEGEFELTVRTKEYHKGKPNQMAPQQVISVPTPAPIAAIPNYSAPPVNAAVEQRKNPAETATPPAAKTENKSYLELKSPIVGTFYRSASPDKPPYAKVGDRISEGDVVCIVEAMKLFNEIESELTGKIVEVLLEDASPVEYDQPLFLIDPNG